MAFVEEEGDEEVALCQVPSQETTSLFWALFREDGEEERVLDDGGASIMLIVAVLAVCEKGVVTM